ncbi:MAG: tetratricopeptide repeat protein [Bryobacteraceae bacterium]|nr:tetratricopeptide repeat protein [Bryobacteraceae bacterium]
MALLQDQIRSTNDKLASLTLLVEQVLDRVNSANTSVVVLDKNVKETLRDQEKVLVAPVAALGSKVDSMSNEFRFVRESVADLNGRLGKLQTQVGDLKSAVDVLAAPPAPPPGGYATPSGGGSPAMSADLLYNNARRDQTGGQLDLALAQYQEFVRNFPNADLAPQAEFHIGEIHYAKGDLQAAIEAFDLVLEKYPENQKTPDAMYMKAMSFAKAGDKASAGRELRALLKKYPDGEVAGKARSRLKELGL